MLRAILVGCLLLRAGHLSALEIVPGSTSPDGRYALAFEHPAPAAEGTPSQLWFVRLPERTLVSVQLRPIDAAIYRKKRDKDGQEYQDYRNKHSGILDSRQLMYTIVVDVAESLLLNQARGEGYHLRWSPEGKEVTVWVGAHKFSWASVYRWHRGRYVRQQDIPSYVPPEWREPAA